MPTVRMECPFCRNQTRVELEDAYGGEDVTNAEAEAYNAAVKKAVKASGAWVQVGGNLRVVHTPFTCPECKQVGVAKVLANDHTVKWIREKGGRGVDASPSVCVLRVSPPPGSELGPGIPDEIRQVLPELEEDIHRGRNMGRILSGCRSVLDVALKELGELSGGRVQRINNLRNKGILTAGIAEWASRLWEDGNDGVHELKAGDHPVSEHIAFLKLFVEVAFVIPKKIADGQV